MSAYYLGADVLRESALRVSVRLTKIHCQKMQVLEPVEPTMASDAFSRRTGIEGIGVAIVPLPVQVVCHINDIVNSGRDAVNREGL